MTFEPFFSCDLICEDDSDDFVHVETPSVEHVGTEELVSVPAGDRSRRFLRHVRSQNLSSDNLHPENLWSMHEISGERVEQIEVIVYV